MLMIWLLLFITISFSISNNVTQEYQKGIDDALRTISNTPFIREIVDHTGVTPGWFNIGLIGVIIGLILVISLNFSADFLNSPRLKAMANVEFKEFAFSLLILLGLLIFVNMMDIIFKNVTSSSSTFRDCNSTQCVYEHIRNIVRDNYEIFRIMVMESLKSAAAKYKSGNVREGIKFEWPGLPSFGVTSLGSFTPYIAEEQYYTLGLYILSLASGIAALTLGIISILGPMLISIGVFLRPLPFFRKLGATMLALGIGFFIILPSLIVLLYSFPPNLGLTYTTNECPDICKVDIVAYTTNKKLTYAEAFSELADKGMSTIQINIFLEGSGNEVEHGITSCEYLNRNLRPIPGITPTILTKANIYKITVDECPKICRKIPYPIEIPTCYFASSACSKLYDQSNGKCFIDLYDLTQLDIKVRLADGSERTLREYIRNTNCTKLLPIRPNPDDYNIYCPLSCRAYYNRIVWGPFTEEQIDLIKSGSTKGILDLVNDVTGQQMSQQFANFLKDDNNFRTVISDIINENIKQVWKADILITCGAMYNLVHANDILCYDPSSASHPIKSIHSAINSIPPDDQTLKDSVNLQYGSGYGDKALQIRGQQKPSADSNLPSNYPIFNTIYNWIGFNTPEEQIIQKFRDEYINKIIINKNSINVVSDNDFSNWKKRFGNIWSTSCGGNDVLDVLQLVINIHRDNSINSVNTDDILKIAGCSQTVNNYIQQFIELLKQQVEIPYEAYGVCDPEQDFGIDCGYSDNSMCPSETICKNIYRIKTEQKPSDIWRNIKSTYFDGAELSPNVMLDQLSKVYLPIYPIERDCSLSSSIPQDLLRFPPSPDCSKCNQMTPMLNDNHLFDYLGYAVFRMITLPLITIFITFVAIISLSEYLGGEIFLPGLGKVR